MTYLPPPAQPTPGPPGMNYYAGPPGRGAAGRASVMLWIFGGLAVLSGLCLNLIVWGMPLDQFVAQASANLTPQQKAQLENIDLTKIIRVVYGAMGIAALLFGAVVLILASFVRKNGRASTITALVLFVLLGLFCAFGVLAGLISTMGGAAAGLLVVLFWLAVGGPTVLTIAWLIQAIRSGGAMQQHLSAQYGQFLQQQQTSLGQSGFGYGVPQGYPQVTITPQRLLGSIPPPDNQNPPESPVE